MSVKGSERGHLRHMYTYLKGNWKEHEISQKASLSGDREFSPRRPAYQAAWLHII